MKIQADDQCEGGLFSALPPGLPAPLPRTFKLGGNGAA